MISLRNYLIPIAAAAAMSVVTFSGAAEAATCTYDTKTDPSSFADFVDDAVGAGGTNDGCFVGSTNQDWDNQPNLDGAFGPSSDPWIAVQKFDFEGSVFDTRSDGGLSVTGNTLSGTWSVRSDIFDFVEEFIIVLKAGGGNIDPSEYVAYLFGDQRNTGGDYNSPFVNANNTSEAGNISHVSMYVRGSDIPDTCPNGGDFPFCDPISEVPVPASLPLLAAGLGIVGIMARRRRRSDA